MNLSIFFFLCNFRKKKNVQIEIYQTQSRVVLVVVVSKCSNEMYLP